MYTLLYLRFQLSYMVVHFPLLVGLCICNKYTVSYCIDVVMLMTYYRISSIFSIMLNIRSPSIFSKIIIFCASKIRSQDFK